MKEKHALHPGMIKPVVDAGFIESREEANIPISKEILKEIEEVAEATRKRIIPEVMRI